MRQWVKKQLGRLQEKRKLKEVEAQSLLKARYHVFRSLLASNNRAVDCLTEISILLRLQGDPAGLVRLIKELVAETGEMVARLDNLTGGKYRGLWRVQQSLADSLHAKLKGFAGPERVDVILPLAKIQPGHASQTGNKAASLAELKKAGLQVPDGFAVTLAGCRRFLEHEGLSMQLVHLLASRGADRNNHIPPDTVRQVQNLIKKSAIPPGLAQQLQANARPFFEKGKALAVRSSSISEDGRHHSFAGQFSSVLNVTDEAQLFAAFKEVVASNFNLRSLSYRLNAGLDPLRFDMAVLCLEMVEARAAGILLSRDPQDPQSGRMLISAVPGLGEAAVAGSGAADLYVVGRDGAMDQERSAIAAKERQLVCKAEGGVDWQDVAPEESGKPVLNAGELLVLADWGRKLEAETGLPQDIEWAVDNSGIPTILQIRPLTSLGGQAPDEWLAASPPIARGITASGGRATGRALFIKNRLDLENLPQEPTVLVMPQSFADAANLLGIVAAILVELGSPADHLACVAREQETPMLCGLKASRASKLAEGQWLTVDGSHGKVYAAGDEEIEGARAAWQNGPPAAHKPPPELPPLYRELQELITPLNLTDAYGPTFSIMECRSLHDIIRFVHEKGVIAMFEAGDEMLEENFGAVHAVEAPVPFFVSVIDMGGGLALTGKKKRRIAPEEVISRPFHALWQGITTPGLHWGPPPGGAPMGSVMSSFLTDHKSERPIGMPNYCIVSRDYCNMNARMDFHFIMIDTVCGPEPRSNHIKFRFKGGGTAMKRRHRRALCIGEIFEHYGFGVDVRDDLVNASLQGANREAIEEKLIMVGRILGFTRLLDAAMADDTMIRTVAQAFYEGDYTLERLKI